MKTRIHVLWASLLLAIELAGPAHGADVDPRAESTQEYILRRDGERTPGRLVHSAGNFLFQEAGAAAAAALEPGTILVFDGPGPDPTAGSPPFRIELGGDRWISGHLSLVDDAAVKLDQSSVAAPVTVVRAGAHAVVQRLGEIQTLDDGFEAIDAQRWSLTGDPQNVGEPRFAGTHSLRIPAGGTSLTCRLAEPVGSGRLEITFYDSGVVVAGQQYFVDLLFRGRAGAETVRTILGWSDESLSIESPGGPALAVQRLARKPGWHRLGVRFGSDQTEVSVDGNDLAHGKGPGGPLAEIRLASHNSTTVGPPAGLAGHFDDLRLVRFAEPAAGLEVDPTQDEVRLSGGDQIFGVLRGADDNHVKLAVDGREISFGWSEVSGIYFRRVPLQAQPIEGLLVRAEWSAAPGKDPRNLDQIEGALMGVDARSLIVATPYAGTLRIARDRMRKLTVLRRARRVVIDGSAHHLGNELVTGTLPLDPPQPEGGVLERTFELAEVPKGGAAIALDVVQVAGEAPGLPFSDKVRQGEIRTSVLLNGTKVDYLNRHIHSKNETSERIRLPIPAGLLRKGQNLLRLEQAGEANDPGQLDDIGVLEIAVEFDVDPAVDAIPEKP